jgi:hypothetical protein
MKDESISFIIDETPVVLSYNRFESDHAWDKKVVITEVELELFGVPDATAKDMELICEEVICRNEWPYIVLMQ